LQELFSILAVGNSYRFESYFHLGREMKLHALKLREFLLQGNAAVGPSHFLRHDVSGFQPSKSCPLQPSPAGWAVMVRAFGPKFRMPEPP
jgi:hypothetical protein